MWHVAAAGLPRQYASVWSAALIRRLRDTTRFAGGLVVADAAARVALGVPQRLTIAQRRGLIVRP